MFETPTGLPLFEALFSFSRILIQMVGMSIIFGVMMLPPFLGLMYALDFGLKLIDRGPMVVKYARLMLRTLLRNLLRTSLTFLAVFVMVFVVTGVGSILAFISAATSEKETNLKIIITEKFRNPSGMPRRIVNDLKRSMEKLPEWAKPQNGDDDFMTWQFNVGSIDPTKRTAENALFMFVMEPRKVKTMMDGMDELSPDEMKTLDEYIALMDSKEKNKQGVLVGAERLKVLGKQIGDKVKVTSFNYKGLEFDLEILGVIPGTRWEQAAVMHADYLNKTLDDFRSKNGKEHENDSKSVALIWIRLPTKEAFGELEKIVSDPKTFETRVKIETASSAIGSFLDAFKDIFWAMRWGLCPAIMATMALVIANAISISVRERRTEMAVLKVLGFRPWHVMGMVLGEALLIGIISGTISSWVEYFAVNQLLGGIKFPIGFFPAFLISKDALWWGPVLGGGTALIGSFLPALSARTIKASEVFSKVS